MREPEDRHGETVQVMEIVPDEAKSSRISAREAANRSVLLKVIPPDSDGPEGNRTSPDFNPGSLQDESGGLVPRLDAGLDHGHRFAMLGAIFRPMRQFLRRTIDPVEQSDLTSTSESSD